MNWNIAIGVTVVVGLLGAIAAILWWRLANKAAPYSDSPTPSKKSSEEVVVIKTEKNR